MILKKRILITGSTGLLGGRLLPFLRAQGIDCVGHGFEKTADVRCDLSLSDDTALMLDKIKPDIIIHLVCCSNVDECERRPDLATRLNVTCLENVTKWIRNNPQTRLVHVSTDHVYDGDGLHSEDDVKILNMYARSKYVSESVALAVDGVVLRTNYFGRSHTVGRSSLSDWVIDGFRNKKPVTLFTDVTFSPLSMETVSGMLFHVANSNVSGVFNLGSHDGMSKRDFAHTVAARLGLSVSSARDGVSNSSGLSAARPKSMLMDITRFESTFGISLPTLKAEIESAEL